MGRSLRRTVAIVDDHPIVRQGLIAVLGSDPALKIVAEGASARDAVDIAKRLQPDVMLLDLDIPGKGIEALRLINPAFPSIHCIVLTVCDRYDAAMEALEAGAKGYILKGVGAGDLKNAVETVLNGGSFISPDFAAQLLLSKPARDVAKSDSLSFREDQIVREVARGLTNREIAERLQISEKTVKHYMTSLMQKLEVKNRVAAVMASQKVRDTNPQQRHN